MTYKDLRDNLIDLVMTFTGIALDPQTGLVLTPQQIVALRALVVAGTPLNPTQTAQWFAVNQCVIDVAQNGPRPSSPYITTHLQLVQRKGSTVYRAPTVLNISQLATFSGAFVMGNSIQFTINGLVLSPILFTTDNATTYNNVKTAISAAFPKATVTVDPVAFTVYIYQPGAAFLMVCTVTGGTPPTVTITAPYSQADAAIYYIEKAVLYLQAYGTDSNLYFQNLQNALQLDYTQLWLDSIGIAYILDTGILDIHKLIDLTYEERYSYDLTFSVGQQITDVSYDINTESSFTQIIQG